MICYKYKNIKYTATELLKLIKSDEQKFHKDNGIKTGLWRYEIEDYLQAVSDVYELQGKHNGVVNENASLFGSKELNKAYPELKNVQVKITISADAKNEGKFVNVYINDKKDSSQITINATDIAKAQSILLHEIQHAIQEIEGFAKGGNKDTGLNLKQKVQWGNINKLKQQGKSNQEIADELTDGNVEIINDAIPMIDKYGVDKIEDIVKGIKTISQLMNTPVWNVYKRLAGEVEARNVEQRIGMTPEQRRETLLTETEDVAREDQIVIMDGVEQAMSLSDNETTPITEAESKTLTDWLNKAFGGAVRVLGLDAFNARAKELVVKPIDIKYPDGTVYGAVLPDGSMYLNPEKLNANTPIHEHTHLFNQVIQKTNPKLWDRMVEAVKGIGLWNEVKNDPNYANLKTDSEIADEVYSRLAGNKGEVNWQERIAKADSKSALGKIGELIKEYWNAIKELFGVDVYKNMTADDFANMTLDKLFRGKEIKGVEEAIGWKDDKSVVKKMMIGGQEVNVKTLPQVTNGFYSPIEKKLLDEKATNLSATKWLERLGKGDEMQFTGLKDFLESKKPNEQVKKSDIQDFMRDNRIEVVEVVKSEDKIGKITRSGWQEGQPNFQGKKTYKQGDYSIEPIPFGGGWQLIFEDGSDFGKKIGTYTELNEAKDAANEENLRLLGETSGTKFSQYQLEGAKENYKEVLVTMPKVEYDYKKEIERKFIKGKYDSHIKDGDSHETALKTIKRYVAQDKTIEEIDAIIKSKPQEEVQNFKSSHWDEPNILVHLRMNTRTDSEGNKVLFLEEVQSDHNQEARKKGVRNEKEMKRISELFDLFLEDRTKNQEGTPERIEYEKLTARNNTQGVPDAPFIKDTNATTKLGLKVALKEAVAQGAERIAWTTGEQQNERYDLSNQVDEIAFSYNESNNSYRVIGGKDSSVKFNQEVSEQNLESVLGKEMAEKIISKKEDSIGKMIFFRGEDLKIGGKGMKGFYGSPAESKLGIVGNVAKKLFGQEPTTITLQDGTTQHAVTITPEMRQQVQEGQPLFMAGEVKPTVNDGGSSMIDEVNTIDSSTRPPSLKEAVKNLKDAVLDLFIGGNNKLGIHYDPKMEALNFYNKGGKVFKTFVDLMKSVATQAGVATMDSKGKLVWKEWANVTQQEKDGLFTEFRNALTRLNTNINIDEDGLEYLALWASDSELMKAKVKAISALQDEIDSLYESFARGETNRQDFAVKVQEVLKDFNRDQKNTSYFSASDIAKLLKAAKDVKDTASLNNFENKFYDIVSGKDFNKLKAATVKLKKAAIRAIQTIKNPNTTSNNPNGVTQGKERLALSYNPLDRRAYNKLPQVLNLQRLPNESNTAYKRAQRLEAERLYREDIRRFNDMLTVMANKEIGKDSAKYKNDINYFADMAAHQFNIKEQEKALRESTYDTDGNLLDIYGNIETLYQDLPAEYQEVADVRKLQFDNNGNIIDTDGNIIKDFNSLDEKELMELERRKKLEGKELNKIKTAAEKEQARLDNKDKIRNLINIGRQVLPFKEFQAILEDFLSITDEQLDKLSNQELEELIKGYDNLINLNRVNTGFEYLIKKALDGSVATEVINTLDSRGNSFRSLLRDRITNIFKGKNIVDGIERFMRNTPLRRIDAIFSGKEGTEMYDTFIYKIAQGMGVFTAFSNKLKDEYRGLTKSIKQDDEFLLRLYTMDRQYRNNPDSDEIMSVAEEVELIREAISLDKNLKESLYADFVELYDKLQMEHGGEFDYTKIQLDKRQQALLDFVDTHLDNTVGKVVVTAARTGEATKIYNNYTPLGRVSSKSITDEMKDFADGIMDFDGGVANREYFSPITPGFIKARQSGKISPIRDVLFSRVTYEAIRGIHLDYNMRDAFKTFENRIKDTERELDNKIKDIRKDAKDKVEKLTEQLENQKQVLTFQLQGADARTARVLNGQIADIDKQIKALDESDIIKASEEKIDAYKNDKMFIQVMGKVVKDVAKDTLHNQYTPLSGIDIYTELVASVGYASVLTSIPRGMAEFASNIFYASLYPVEMMLGVKQLAKMLKDDRSVNKLKELLTQIPSTQPNRLIVHSGSLRRDTAETKKFGIAATVGRGKRIVENLTSAIDSVNDAILGTSDRVISMPMWLGAFEKEFNNQKRIEIKNRLGRSNYNSESEFNAAVSKELKKEKLNLEEFVNSSDYRFKNKEISDKAVKFADRVLTEGFASFNAFEGIPNLKMTKGDGFLKVYDKFLQRFNKFEYQSFEDSISSLLGRGYLSKNEAARVLTATLSRLAIYNYLTGKLRDWWNDEAFAPAVNAVSNTIGEALGVEGDKDLVAIPDRVDNTEEEDLYKKKRAFIGGLISVSLQRRLGGLGRLPINFAVEMANGLYGEDLGLRKGVEYNAYENSLLFSTVKIPNFTSLQREDGELSDNVLNIPFTDKAMGLKAISPDKYLIDLFVGMTGPYSVFSKNMADISRLAFRNLGLNKDLAFLKTINPYKEQAVIDYANNIIGYKFLASQIPIPMAKDVHVVMNNSLSAINFGVAIKDNDYKNATKSNATQMDIELGVKAVERLIKEETSLMKERLIDIIESEEIFNKIEDAYINGIGAKTPESFTVALKNEKGKYNKKNTYSTFTLSDDSVIWGTTTEIDKSDFEDLSEKGRLVYDVYNGEDNTTKYFEVKPVRNKYQLAQLNKLYTYSKYQKVWEDIMVKLHSESLFKHVEPYEREFGVIGWKAKPTKLTEIGEEDPDTEIDITKYFRN